MRTVLRVCILTFLMCLSSSATFADSFGNNGFETGGFTGWSTIGDTLASFTANAGDVGVGVVDFMADPSVNSAVLVGTFQVTGPPEPGTLPEPGTWLLLGSALIGVVLYRSPRSQTGLLLLRRLARKSSRLG